MQNNLLISIIIPVYNVESFLNTCIESVVNQTYKNIEIILVDDGSNDSSGVICDRWGEQDSRISVYHKENGGLSDARNFGIVKSKGDFISFVDSDDVVSKTLIETLSAMLFNTKSDIAICDAVHIFDNSKIEFQIGDRTELFTGEQAIEELLYQKKFLPSAWGKLYARYLFSNIRFPYGMLFEDVAIMYKLFLKSKKIIYGNDKLYGYLHRENSITTQRFSSRDLDILKIAGKQFEDLSTISGSLESAALAYQMVAYLRIYLNSKGNESFENERNEAKRFIKSNSIKVLLNRKTRFKLKISILLFLFFRPLMNLVYRKIDRWK